MFLVALAAVTTILAGAGFVEVRSDTDCPSAEEVTARLRPMLPAGWVPGPDGDVASIAASFRADGVTELRVQLLHPDGSVGGDRQLVLRGSCAEMADAIATVIAAWETNFLPALPPSAEPTATVQPMVKVEATTKAPPAPNTEPTVNAVRAEPGQARIGASLGAAVGVAVVGGIATTAGLEADAGRRASRWRLRLAAATQTDRRQALDEGEVSWKHTTIAAGLVLRSLGPNWRVSVDGGPILGWATLGGHGYDANRTQSVFEYGLGAGLRVERAWGRFSLWLEWRTNIWSESQQAVLTGSISRQTLSRVDGMASLGASVGYFP